MDPVWQDYSDKACDLWNVVLVNKINMPKKYIWVYIYMGMKNILK